VVDDRATQGGFESFAALDDEMLARFGSRGLMRLMHAFTSNIQLKVPGFMSKLLLRHAQATAGQLNARIRRDTLANDLRLDKLLAFAGQGE
jgi:preprotein translocase subunit SecA